MDTGKKKTPKGSLIVFGLVAVGLTALMPQVILMLAFICAFTIGATNFIARRNTPRLRPPPAPPSERKKLPAPEQQVLERRLARLRLVEEEYERVDLRRGELFAERDSLRRLLAPPSTTQPPFRGDSSYEPRKASLDEAPDDHTRPLPALSDD